MAHQFRGHCGGPGRDGGEWVLWGQWAQVEGQPIGSIGGQIRKRRTVPADGDPRVLSWGSEGWSSLPGLGGDSSARSRLWGKRSSLGPRWAWGMSGTPCGHSKWRLVAWAGIQQRAEQWLYITDAADRQTDRHHVLWCALLNPHICHL